ncbi:MAG: hypothetical protein KJ067_24330 [Vicinamibacteria bacterium]|nr:hypothetical protein [Vicinamibacteria bacterium]
MPRASMVAVLVAAAAAFAGGTALVRLGPLPVAAAARGGEDAFATGIYPRELPPGRPPLRWTRAEFQVAFERLPAVPLDVEVVLPGRRGAAILSESGRIVARLAPGESKARFALAAGGRRREIRVAVEPFVASDGRALGAQLERVAVGWARAAAWPAPGLIAWLVLAGLGTAAGAGRARGGPLAVALGACLGVGVAVLLLWPVGLAWSGAAPILAGAVAGCGLLAGELGRRRGGGPGPEAALLAAALFACLAVFGLAATSPAMVVSDAVFQANKLKQVAGGDLFPVSVTQHEPPFRFPYGVAFFAVLAPLARLGLDPVDAVRWGAALSFSAAALAWVLALAPLGARAAAAAGLALAATPIAFDVFSYGNLANVFAQAATLGLLAWWIAPTPGGWPLGALLAVGAGLGHLSGALVLWPLGLALLAFDGRRAGAVRLAALAAGLLASAAYYGSFVPLVAEQLGRLGEGGGRGAGLVAGLAGQLQAALSQLGLPLLALAGFAALPPREERAGGVVRAALLATAALALVAALSPLEPRYLYALTGVLALLAGRGAVALAQRGRAGAWTAGALLALAAARALANLAEALVTRYR